MRRNTYARISVYLFKKMLVAAAWYAGIFIAIIIAMTALVKSNGWDAAVADAIGMNILNGITVISGYSTQIYMLATGIVFPLIYLQHFIAAGTTRRQFRAGMYAAGVGLAVCLTALRAVVMAAAGGFTVLDGFIGLAGGLLAFVAGWTAAVGFQYMAVGPIVLGIAASCVLWAGWILAERFKAGTVLQFGIGIAEAIAGAFMLTRAVRNIPVKC
jgi:hypothetical protein